MDINEYRQAIYKEAGILTAALAGAKALAGSGVGKKVVGTVTGVAKAGVGKKMAVGAGVGAAGGAIQGNANYNKAQDDGSFGKSQLGQTLKGMAGGAAGGAAIGGALGGIQKGVGKTMAKIKTVGAKAPAGTAAATVTTKPKPPVIGGGDGNPIRNSTGLSLEDQMKKKGLRTTGAAPVINSVPIQSVAGDDSRETMEKVAIELGPKIKELLAKIKALPKTFINADPEIRAFIGAAAGAGLAALTLGKIQRVEKSLAQLEKKLGGKIPLSKIQGRAASAVGGGAAGALFGYTIGNKKFGQGEQKTASEILHEILK